MKPTLPLLFPAGLSLLLSSCVSWNRYEATLRRADKFEHLAELRRDTIAGQDRSYAATYRANEELQQKNQLLHNELSSTRTQYAQLETANTNVLERYDRYLAQTVQEASAMPEPAYSISAPAAQAKLPATSLSQRPTQPNDATAAGDRSTVRHELRTAPKEANSDNVYLALKSAIVGFTGREASVVRQDDYVVVRLSEHLLYPDGQPRLSSLGQSAVRQIARALAADRALQAIVYASSRREGLPSEVQSTNAMQARTLGQALLLEGAEPGQVAVDETGISAKRVGAEGSLGSSLDGEVVLLIRERDFRLGAGMFGAN